MRVITKVGTENTNELNTVPVGILAELCKEHNLRLTISNGLITDGTIIHRDYVSIYDGRINYI